MRFIDCVADLRAALSSDGVLTAREALLSLHMDGLTEALGYTQLRQSSQRRVVSAVSPQTRLHVELLSETHDDNGCMRARVHHGRLSYHMDAGSIQHEDTTQRLFLAALWWAVRCGLPIDLYVGNTQTQLLRDIPSALRCCVSQLHVSLPSTACLVEETEAAENGDGHHSSGRNNSNSDSSSTFLGALWTFRSLELLTVSCASNADSTPLEGTVLPALQVAAQLAVPDIVVRFCGFLHDAIALSTHTALRSFTSEMGGLRSLAGLRSCHCLTDVTVRGSTTLGGLSGLAGAPSLQQCTVTSCGLRSLDGLDRCPCLTYVMVEGNASLTSLAGLAGAPRLEKVVAWACDVRSLEGLALCPRLTELNVDRNVHLESLVGLAGSPSLRSVSARYCSLRSLAGLENCDSLVSVDVFRNARLRSVAAVAGARRLAHVDLRGCKDTDAHLLPASIEMLRGW